MKLPQIHLATRSSGGADSLNYGGLIDYFFNNFVGEKFKPAIERDVRVETLYVYSSITNACVRLLSDGASDVPIALQDGSGTLLRQHPILKMLRKPSKMEDSSSFWRSLYSWVVTSGHVYVAATGQEKSKALEAEQAEIPSGLEIINPSRISIKNDKSKAKVYEETGDSTSRRRTWKPTRPYGFMGGLLHIWEWSPAGETKIKGRVFSAGQAAEAHALGASWNRNLISNSGRPSGLVSIGNGQRDVFVSKDRMNEILAKLKEQIEGPDNAGKTLVSQNGDYKRITMTPQEMDWTKSRLELAREVAQTMGVPAQVIGIPGSDTFRNMELANLALYTQTIIPLVRHVLDNLNLWLVPRFGSSDLELVVDEEKMPQMAVRRKEAIEAIMKLKEIGKLNELREKADLDPLEGELGDMVWKNGADMPIDMIVERVKSEIENNNAAAPNDQQIPKPNGGDE